MITTEQEKIIKETLIPFEPSMVGIFGSYARNEQTHSSDIDILVDLKRKINLLDLIGIEQELTELLGIKVDLITLRSVNEQLKSSIQKDIIRII
jgi:predicted nucleotidyltransferase